MTLTISILDALGNEKATATGQEISKIVYYDGYDDGDVIQLTTDKVPGFYEIKIDETIEKAQVYMKEKQWSYKIDFSKRGKSLHPLAFENQVHFLYFRILENPTTIMLNPLDQENNQGMYPHVSSNAQTRGEPAFACTNVIDGIYANTRHAKWPYTSWGIGGRKDAKLKVDFGRMVDIQKITFYLRAQFPHDSYWQEGKLSFNGQDEIILKFRKTEEAQIFEFDDKKASYIEFYDLIKANDESPFPSLSLIEVIANELN